MYRKKISLLAKWKQKSNRKPLILQGARQVGKTYLLEEFGKEYFESYYLFDCEKQKKELGPIFEKYNTPRDILENLSLLAGKVINPGKDLVVFDEVQVFPSALTSLKYFYEEIPELHLCVAGSLLGVLLSKESYPVGKVEYCDLYPMTFEEFLYASGKDLLIEQFDAVHKENLSFPIVAHQQCWEILKYYYVTGGMPAAVRALLSYENWIEGLEEVRNVQANLLRDYVADINKHSGELNAMHIASVFENIPIQLSQTLDETTKRFYFKDVIPGKKGFAELEGPITWLDKSGLIQKVLINNKPEIPLKSFCKHNLFKLFLFDVGLLGTSLEIPPQSLMLQDYGITKGYFAENFVANELVASGVKQLYCWEHQTSEIEFLDVYNGNVIPIEVKSGNRTQAKSLKQYVKRYKPAVSIKVSANPLSLEDGMLNLPLYMTGKLHSVI